MDAINLSELEALARAVLPPDAYDYYASGANDEITLRENRTAFERIAVHPRMLVDVSIREMGTSVLGEPVSMPILVAPMAFQAVAHPGGKSLPPRRPEPGQFWWDAQLCGGLAPWGGESGVKFVLEMLRQEFDLAIGLAGCPRLADISRDLLRPLGVRR